MAWGDKVETFMRAIREASADSRWGKDRDKRQQKKQKPEQFEPLVLMYAHLNKWQADKPELLQAPLKHTSNSRCFLLPLPNFDCVALVADRLLQEATRTAIAYKNKDGQRCVPEAKMRESQMYILRLPDGNQVVLPVKRGVDEWTEPEELRLLAEMAKAEITNWCRWSCGGDLLPTRATSFAKSVAHLFCEHHPIEGGSIERKVAMLLLEGHPLFKASFSSELKMRSAKEIRGIDGWPDSEERMLLAEMATAGITAKECAEVPQTGRLAQLYGTPSRPTLRIPSAFVNAMAHRFEWHPTTMEIEGKVRELLRWGPTALKDHDDAKARDAKASELKRLELERLERQRHPRRNGISIGADGWTYPEERTMLAAMGMEGMSVENPSIITFAKKICHLFRQNPNVYQPGKPANLGYIARKVRELLKVGPTAPKDDDSKASDTKDDTSKASDTMDDTSKESDTKDDTSMERDTKDDTSKESDAMDDTPKESDIMDTAARAAARAEDWKSMTRPERIISKNNLRLERMAAMQRAVEEAAAQKRAERKAAASDIVDTAADDPTASDSKAPVDDTKYIMMIVLPTGTPVSTVEFFKSLKDITPLGCVLPADFAKEITHTGWRSMETGRSGKWCNVGPGTDKALHPFLMRTSVAQASTAGE